MRRPPIGSLFEPVAIEMLNGDAKSEVSARITCIEAAAQELADTIRQMDSATGRVSGIANATDRGSSKPNAVVEKDSGSIEREYLAARQAPPNVRRMPSNTGNQEIAAGGRSAPEPSISDITLKLEAMQFLGAMHVA